jgi:hypothetical protein
MEIQVTDFGTSAGGGIVTQFTDSFAIPDFGPINQFGVLSRNWMATELGFNSPYTTTQIGTPSIWTLGATLSGGGGLGLSASILQTGANPTYFAAGGIIPVKLFSTNLTFYLALQKFIQITYNACSNVVGVFGVMNLEDFSGVGAAGNGRVCHDAYHINFAAPNTGGDLFRDNSGALSTSLHAATNNIVQGDVLRLSYDASVSGQVTLTFTRNGTVQYTVVDNNANRLGPKAGTSGGSFPFIGMITATAAEVFEIKNFSAGIGL